MKYCLRLLPLFLCIAATSNAQVNIGALMDAHNSANASLVMPTYLGDHFQRFQITLFNTYAGLGSNFATMDNAREYLTADQITKAMLGSTLGSLQAEDNNIAGLVNVSIVNAAFNIRGPSGRKFATIGFDVSERVEVNALFNRDLLQLAYGGNKQFADQTINVVPRFNGLAFTQYSISGALDLALPGSNVIIKPALRLSLLSGQASVHMGADNSITLYTEPQGRYLDFGFNYNMDVSAGADSANLSGSSFNLNNKSFSTGAGSGFGMDVGLRISPAPGLSFNIGVTDLGSINFKNHVTNIYNHSSKRYEGEQVNFVQDQGVNLDSLSGIADPSYSHNAFTVTLPTKLVLSGSYGFQKVEAKSGTYYRDQIYAVYVQGFANYLSATTRPYVAVGYTHSFHDVLNVGLNAGAGGLTGGTFGVLASVKAGAFRIGVNSNNIVPLIAQASGKGADIGLMLGLAF